MFVDPLLQLNRFYLKAFSTVTMECGIPVAWDKTSEDPSQVIVFYGVELGTVKMQAHLPPDKLSSYTKAIEEALKKTLITIKELQSLTGKLQFATCAVSVGQLFLRRLHDLMTHSPQTTNHTGLYK